VNGIGTAPPDVRRARELGQEEFMELMVAQLRNQDPLKPLESGEFLGQIAQFSTVAGIQELQTSFEQVSGALYSSQALQASSLVGRTVLVATDRAELTAERGLATTVMLDAPARELSLNVYAPSGRLVRTLRSGPHAGGPVTLVWNGRTDDGGTAAPGVYRVTVTDPHGSSVQPLMPGRVASVTLGGPGGGISLNLGAMGAIRFEDVREIR
jgi:flagellar basal-body rod modification protein FlgD